MTHNAPTDAQNKGSNRDWPELHEGQRVRALVEGVIFVDVTGHRWILPTGDVGTRPSVNISSVDEVEAL